MTKDELIQLTIDQLSESLNSSLVCFELHEDPVWPYIDPSKYYTTILWKFKVEVDGNAIPDPNNSPRTIILGYCHSTKQLSCQIFFRDVESPNKAIMADATVRMTYKVPMLNKSYRKFSKLRKTIIKRLKEKDQLDYLKKLNSIFPTALDENLFD